MDSRRRDHTPAVGSTRFRMVGFSPFEVGALLQRATTDARAMIANDIE